MSTKFNINPKKITLSEDSPLMREMRKPQLMLVRHFGFSTFFKNKKLNEEIQDEWRRANPHKVTRPKAREQTLNTEMTKDEYLRQERERAQTKKKK
tara:strand:- start:1194 stop:1481 length:288 start_codon:yes stop_codon:yes gene_type:complete